MENDEQQSGSQLQGDVAGCEQTTRRMMLGIMGMGLMNNIIFCVILAGGKEIEEGGVALVFLVMQVPGMLVKVTGPLWYHMLTYSTKVSLVATASVGSLLIAALSQSGRDKLIGVAMTSVQIALGEATLLSLCSTFTESRLALSAWSAGTGVAGLAGFGWVMVLEGLGLSLSRIFLMSLIFPAAYVSLYFSVVPSLDHKRRGTVSYSSVAQIENDETTRAPSGVAEELSAPMLRGSSSSEQTTTAGNISSHLTATQKIGFVISLWQYMLPLSLVYFAEYVMQSGTWSAIGFPLEEEEARNKFYRLANLCYQGGVFVSRSSGLLFEINMPVLWLLPVCQLVLLLLFMADCIFKFWYDWTLLLPCVFAGLLGGTVYVQGFSLLAKRTEPGRKELAMGSVAMASDIGVACADFIGIVVQGCIYRYHGLPGADYKCDIITNSTLASY